MEGYLATATSCKMILKVLSNLNDSMIPPLLQRKSHSERKDVFLFPFLRKSVVEDHFTSPLDLKLEAGKYYLTLRFTLHKILSTTLIHTVFSN